MDIPVSYTFLFARYECFLEANTLIGGYASGGPPPYNPYGGYGGGYGNPSGPTGASSWW